MKNIEVLDQEEQQILDGFKKGIFKQIPKLKKEKQQLEDAERQTLLKDKRINISIPSRDLVRLQKRAAKEGIPYQTYISETLHKLVTGRLKEVV